MSQHKEGYYPIWLTDQECGEDYKRKLVAAYDDYYYEKDSELRKEKFKTLRVYLTIVCDVVAYRYLIKYYTNLFHRLNITIEEYMDYKVERMYLTIRDKKEKIEDILSYVYMSFMLSSPRLIYDYGEKVGRCKSVKEVLPYFTVQRMKFFFIERENQAEHYIYNVDNIDLDEDTESIRSNLDKYSLSQYHREQSKQDSNSGFDVIREFIENYEFKYEKSKKYLLNIFDNWEESVEDDFLIIKQQQGAKNDIDFNLFDYIRYKYENKQTDLSYYEYLDILNVLNKLLKRKKELKP